MGTYARAVTGADVRGAVVAFAWAGIDAARVAALVEVDERFADAAALRRRMPPRALGITDGAWQTVFAPLFGEFE